MIEQLYEEGICDRDGNLYGMSAPSNFELMEKINELVEEVNRLKKKLEEDSTKMWIAREPSGLLVLSEHK